MIVSLLLATSINLLFGYMPETFGLLFFGIVLIVSAIGLRWFLKRTDKKEHKENFNH